MQSDKPNDLLSRIHGEEKSQGRLTQCSLKRWPLRFEVRASEASEGCPDSRLDERELSKPGKDRDRLETINESQLKDRTVCGVLVIVHSGERKATMAFKRTLSSPDLK